MPAYLIYLCQEIYDHKELEIYWSKIGETLSLYEVKVITAYAPFEQLEGDSIQGSVVVEFESAVLAKAWYDGPEYTAVRQHRMKGGRFIGILAEGDTPPPERRMLK